MTTVNYVFWQDEGTFLGYLEEFPDYWTQGESLDDLEVHLRELHEDLRRGDLPGVRRIGHLAVA